MDYSKIPEQPLPLVEISVIMNSDKRNKYSSPPSFMKPRITQILELINYFVNKPIPEWCSLTYTVSLKVDVTRCQLAHEDKKVIDSFLIHSKVPAY